MRTSTLVEVQGDKLRKRNDWRNWLPPPPNLLAAVSGPPSPATSSYDMLATRIQNVRLDNGTGNQRGPVDSHIEGVLSRSSSGESHGQLAMPSGFSNGEGMGQVFVSIDRSMSARSLGKNDSD
ncbi:uncharacterized protein LOC143854348 [Tasmannia lanceolata]